MDNLSASDIVMPSAELVQVRLVEAIAVKKRMAYNGIAESAVEVAKLMVTCLRSGGTVIFLGNGGSAQDAGHLAAELMGRLAFDRPGLAAISLPDATATMTAIGNDYSYDDVFARQITAIGHSGDVVIGLTTSGNSVNVVRAFEAAAYGGMTTVALTGTHGRKAAASAQIAIRIPSNDTPRIQEACLHLGHTICEMVEAALFPKPS